MVGNRVITYPKWCRSFFGYMGYDRHYGGYIQVVPHGKRRASMKIFKDKIDKQFEFNQGKNLFYDGILNSVRFSPETLLAIEKIDLIDSDSENVLIDYLTNRAVQEFCKINQYYSFDKQAHLILRSLYSSRVRCSHLTQLNA